MPLEDFSGMTVRGKSIEAYKAEQVAEEKQQADVWKRLQMLEQLQKDLEALRKKHQELVFELRDFGMTLGLLQVDTTSGLLVKESEDGT